MSLRIGKVEKADLSLQVSYGFVLHGSLADFIKAREMLEKLEDSRLIYNTADTRRLFIVREKIGSQKGGSLQSQKENSGKEN